MKIREMENSRMISVRRATRIIGAEVEIMIRILNALFLKFLEIELLISTIELSLFSFKISPYLKFSLASEKSSLQHFSNN